MKKLRIYLDTSVIGGCCDEEFAEASRSLLALAQTGKVVLLISDLMATETQNAPVEVQQVLDNISDHDAEAISASAETRALRDAYLAVRVVGPTHANDAHHVAIATVAQADMIVSWNFKDIVHYDKIRGFNAVNLREGYGVIAIHSPLEVV